MEFFLKEESEKREVSDLALLFFYLIGLGYQIRCGKVCKHIGKVQWWNKEP